MKTYDCKPLFTQSKIPKVVKHSLNISFCDPSFFKNTSKFMDFFVPPDTPVEKDSTLKYHERAPNLRNILKCIFQSSRLLITTSFITASPSLLVFFFINFPHLEIDEDGILITIESLLFEKKMTIFFSILMTISSLKKLPNAYQ